MEVSTSVAETVTTPAIAPSGEGSGQSAIDGGLTLGAATPAATEPQKPAVETGNQTQEPEAVAQKSPEVAQYEEKMRRYQSDRDKAEAYARNLVNEVMPYVNIDERTGKVMGYRQPAQAQPQQPSQEEAIAQMVEAASLGDKNALFNLTLMSKDMAKKEAVAEFEQKTNAREAMAATEAKIKQDFSYMVKPDGGYDDTNPVFIEAQRLIREEFPGQLNPYNPTHLRLIMDTAEARVLKTKFPEIEGKIKAEAQAVHNRAGGSSVVSPTSPTGQSDPMSELTPELMGSLKREGYKPEDYSRINNIIKQAKERNGYYL